MTCRDIMTDDDKQMVDKQIGYRYIASKPYLYTHQKALERKRQWNFVLK